MKKFYNILCNIKNSQFVNHISFLWHWKNFFFLLKYPFYRVHNRWTGKFMGYSYTELDAIPYGWRKAFGKQMTEDIRKAGQASRKRIGKHLSWKQMITWEQIKEKYGELCLYARATKEIHDILCKYERMSLGYCICCGKPAHYCTQGWIEYYCEDCLRAEIKAYDKYRDNPITEEEIQKELKRCRLTEDDIPKFIRYEYETIGSEIVKKEDFDKRWNELWDSEDRPKDISYCRNDNEDGTITIKYIKSHEYEVNTEEEYGFSYKELWGLK